MLSASKPCHLAMVRELVAWAAVGLGQGLPASQTRCGVGIRQGLYLLVRAHTCTGGCP